MLVEAKLVELLLNVWYYQVWLLVMYVTGSRVLLRTNEVYAAAVYTFLAYVAVTWHPILEFVHVR